MNRVYCEKEMEILGALRRDAWDPEPANHVASCAICADTLAVSKFLLADRTTAVVRQCHSDRSEEPRMDLTTSTIDEDTLFWAGLPDSDFLWWKAQLARKRIAMDRATRSISLVTKVSYLGAAAAGLWLVFSPGPLGSILSVLSRHEIWPAGAFTQTALFLGVGALASTLLGSLYLARPEK